MKKHVVQVLISIVLFFVVFLSYQCYTLNSRIKYLESEIKLSSSHSPKSNANLNQLEYRVSKLTEDKDFFKSIYFDNGSWFIGGISLLTVLILALSAYSVRNELKDHKEESNKIMEEFKISIIEQTTKKPTEYKEKTNDSIRSLKTEFMNMKYDLYGTAAMVYKISALLCRKNEEKEKPINKQDLTEYIWFLIFHVYSYLKQDLKNEIYSLEKLNEILKIIENPKTNKLKTAKIAKDLVRLNEFNIHNITEKVSEILTALDQRT